jgi:hypothetical protein
MNVISDGFCTFEMIHLVKDNYKLIEVEKIQLYLLFLKQIFILILIII